ncbi:ankyrin repeat-containing protein BDA1-like [Hibiscus syriacus]|uniref:ankyrin repeat-containing protein BDA1-like n=1 Tax=Hibiscus syriacus TaxID=106335 RepID=UPI001921E279|nr:ankyrin repeat-containing protein BDA1-like [Hibiscus syriacus]
MRQQHQPFHRYAESHGWQLDIMLHKNSLAVSLRRKLNEAAKAGNIDGLYDVIGRDPYILDRISEIPFVDTPVHVAVTSGHVYFAMEVMNLKSSFARKLNKDGYSPVHLALQNERTLLCLLDRDKDLIRVKVCSESIHDLTIRDKTALHVAANNDKLEALRVLAQLLRRTYLYSSSTGKKLLNWKDKDGNTVLHVAAYNNQPKLDVIQELQFPDGASKRDVTRILLNAEALNASSTPRPQHLHERLRSIITFTERAFGKELLGNSNNSFFHKIPETVAVSESLLSLFGNKIGFAFHF